MCHEIPVSLIQLCFFFGRALQWNELVKALLQLFPGRGAVDTQGSMFRARTVHRARVWSVPCLLAVWSLVATVHQNTAGERRQCGTCDGVAHCGYPCVTHAPLHFLLVEVEVRGGCVHRYTSLARSKQRREDHLLGQNTRIASFGTAQSGIIHRRSGRDRRNGIVLVG